MTMFKLRSPLALFSGKPTLRPLLAVDFEDGDRDHEVAGELEGVGLSEGKIVRHMRGSIRSGPIPARWLLKRPGDGRGHREAKPERPQLASGPFTG